MPTLITKNLGILLAKQFYNLLELSANSYLPDSRKSYIYVVLGKQESWDNESSPSTPTEDQLTRNQYFRDAFYGKRLSSADASFVVPRVNWEANTNYNTYESNTNFYVLNSKYQVFKCLDNTDANTVTVTEPEITLSTTSLEEPYINTSDGYKWKYLYSLTADQRKNFLSDDWLPVTSNKFVRNAAKPGSIDIVKINDGGTGYANGSAQEIITVDGDGTGAELVANVVAGEIVDVIIQTRGTNYTYGDLIVEDVAGGSGSGANLTISIAPHDGHGYDPIYELDASTLMFNVEFDREEGGYLPTDIDYRRIFLLSNPFTYNTTTPASSTYYTFYTKAAVSPGIGDYTSDETVYQGETLETASFTAKVVSFDEVENQLYLNDVRGTFATNAILKGASAQRVVLSYINPTIDLYSGKILYIVNQTAITRDADQKEQIRFILSF